MRRLPAMFARLADCPRLLPLFLCGTFSLVSPPALCHAAITAAGDVEPTTDPSTWTLSTAAYIGNTSAGTLAVNGGSALASQSAYVGYNSTATGAVAVDGSSSTWTNSDYLYVGYSGSGTLSITNGGGVSCRVGSGIYSWDYIAYANGSTGTVTVDGASTAWTNDYLVYVGYGGAGTLRITNGGTVSSSVEASIGNASTSTGAVTIDGAGSNWTDTGSLYVGYYGHGTLKITNSGAARSFTDCYLGYGSASTAAVAVDGLGSTWTDTTGGVNVGYSGSGTLKITNGGAVSDTYGCVGGNSASSGTVTIDGSGSAWNNSSYLCVGSSGTGTLNITNGGTVGNSYGSIGNSSGSPSTVTVDGHGSTWTNSSYLYVGASGGGMLNITNVAVVSVAGSTYTGYQTNSNCTINFGANGGTLTTQSLFTSPTQLTGTGTINCCGLVSDVDLIFDATHGPVQTLTFNSLSGQDITVNLDTLTAANNGALGAGYHGAGSLTIRDGVTVASTYGYLGFQPGSSGVAAVSGVNSTWTNTYKLYVGYSGAGMLSVAGAGAVRSSGGYIGYNSGSSGTVLVDGVGSTWTDAYDYYVGYSGAGTLKITNGGVFNSTYQSNANYIAYNSGSAGTVIVDGNASAWTGNFQYYIGYSGAGTLKVTNGGAVNSNWSYVGENSGSSGTVSVDGGGSEWSTSQDVYLGYYGSGALTISNGGAVSTYICGAGYGIASATGAITVDGAGSAWTSSDLFLGEQGAGTLKITNGGAARSDYSYIGYDSLASGTVSADGIGSTFANSNALIVGYLGSGTLSISGGASVTATSVSINGSSLLAIDVGRGSSLALGSGTISNSGNVRLLAGAGVAAGGAYSPIAAGSWGGSGTYQAVGGTWNATAHQFSVSAVQPGVASTPVSIDLSQEQRVLVSDTTSGAAIGVSFLATTASTPISLTATTLGGAALSTLQGDLPAGQSVLDGWGISTRGYDADYPAYLSLLIGAGYTPYQLATAAFSRDNLSVWDYNGTTWSQFQANDLTFDGSYASFTVTALNGYDYAVVGIPLLLGDANRDGKVDINDLTIVLTNFGQSAGMSWSTGDFIGDGRVDINDLCIVLANFGQTAGSSAAAIAPVPEPSTVALLLASAVCLLALAWRRRT